jgi:serine/threonine-protein kinase
MSKDPKEKQFLIDKGKDIFRQVATGLAYMNASGYVHCDIKPDNILVNSLGQAKIIDFAISKPVKKGFFAKLFHRPGKPQGTPSYMSPEQINDELLDGRADVYCYGAMLYEIVTGRPPFRGANTNELLKKHLVEKPPPPQSHNPDLTDDFSNYVLKLLAKKKDERPRNFHEVLMTLKDLRVYKVTGGKGKAPAAG